MYKKWIAAALAAALVLALAGCMPTESGGFKNPFASQQNTGEDEPEKATLTISVEGVRKDIEAEIYHGNGYTIAVPLDWERSVGEPEWSPYNNDDVELTVRFYPEQKAEAVAEQFKMDEDDYVFEGPLSVLGQGISETLQGALMLQGTDRDLEGSENLVTYFIDAKDGCYALILECPTEATEGYGMYLGAMANSFTLAEETE